MQTETINVIKFITNSINPIISKIKRQKPSSGNTNSKFHYNNEKPSVVNIVITLLKQSEYIIIRYLFY